MAPVARPDEWALVKDSSGCFDHRILYHHANMGGKGDQGSSGNGKKSLKVPGVASTL